MPMKNSVRTLTIVFRGFPWITSAFFHIPNKLFDDYLTSQCCTEFIRQINQKYTDRMFGYFYEKIYTHSS